VVPGQGLRHFLSAWAGVNEIVSFISRVMTLLPGDVILTGTPGGVGPIVAGNRVEVEIERIGSLVNTVTGG